MPDAGNMPKARAKYQAALATELYAAKPNEQSNGDGVVLSADVDIACAQVCSRVTKAAKDTIGLKTVGPRSRIWWDEEIKALIVQRHEALTAGNKAEYKRLSREVHKVAAEKKALAISKLATELEEVRVSDNKRYWGLVKALGGFKGSSAITEVRLADGSVSSDPEVIRNHFKEHFERLGNQGHDGAQFDAKNFEYVSKWRNCDLSEPVVAHGAAPDLEEVREALVEQAAGAPGNDGIPMELLKYGGVELEKKLTRLFGLWWTQGKTPRALKEASIVPLHKKGDAADPNNYRGISLLNVIGKVYTRILHKRLYAAVGRHIVPAQAGFVSGRNTVDQIFVLHDVIGRFKCNKKDLFIAFLDVAKAYDTVWRDALWFKMDKMGVPRKLRKVIEELYSDSFNVVSTLGGNSTVFAINIGLRQGCVLSPLLFDIFINDYAEGWSPAMGANIHFGTKPHRSLCIHSLLFADDIAFLGQSASGLQDCLDRFTAWCRKWRMVISVAKSKVMVVGSTPAAPFEIPGYGELEVVKAFKYLGVWLSDDGQWDMELEHKRARFTAACAAANGILRLRCLSLWDRTRIWTALCRPHLEYAADVINKPDDGHWRKFLAAQMRPLKALLRCPLSAQSVLVLAECGLPSMEARVTVAHLRLLHRMSSVNNNAVLPRRIWAAPAPGAMKVQYARVFLKDKVYANLYTRVKALADAEFTRQAEASVEAEAQGKPAPKEKPEAEVWHDAIVQAVREGMLRFHIKELESGKAPAARFYKSPVDFQAKGSSYLKVCSPAEATVYLKARTATLAVAARVSRFGTNVSPHCVACKRDSNVEIIEDISHFLLDCPALHHIRRKFPAFAAGAPVLPRTELVALFLNARAESIKLAASTVLEMWHLRCRIHFGRETDFRPEPAVSPNVAPSSLPATPVNAPVGVLVTSVARLPAAASAGAPSMEELDSFLTTYRLRSLADAPVEPTPTTTTHHRSLSANGQLSQAEL